MSFSCSIQPFSSPIPNAICSCSTSPCNRKSSLKSSAISSAGRADQMFVKMPDRISGIFPPSQASMSYSETLKSGGVLDEFMLGSLLKASSDVACTSIGEQLHARSIRAGLASEPGVRTSLIAMYSSSGFLDPSRQVFDEVSPVDEADVPSWNSIISAYVLHGRYDECFRLFTDMLVIGGLMPTEATYASLITACASMEDIKLGMIMHAMVIKDGAFDKTKLLNSLITMYAKCGHLEFATRVFKAMDRRNIVSWNALIAGHEQNGEYEYALSLFRRLARFELVKPNRITFLGILSAITGCSALKLGREVHAQVIRSGLECETSIGNSLVTLYGKCGEVLNCRLLFERFSRRDVITWNSMLMGYAQNKQPESCCKLFREMILLGIKPDGHTLAILLGALSSETFISNCHGLSREIHAYFLRVSGSRMLNLAAYNAIIAMHGKCGRLEDAKKLFEWMVVRDSYSWNAMMDACSVNGCYDNAIMLFVEMHSQGLQSDHLTLSILLAACGRLASVELGKQIHAFLVKHHVHTSSRQFTLLSMNNALVSMYSKCGSISDAVKVFHRMVRKDVFSWTAMITGYAQHGMACESFEFFEGMKRDGIKPNSVTFLGLLAACAHAGLLKEGTHCFSSMSKDFSIEPSVEHYACMVGLYGRFGQFERAEHMVETGISQLALGLDSCVCLWKVLLGACHARRKLELGVKVARRIIELDPEDETSHVLLSNLYASFGLWKDAISVRSMMKEKGLKKEAGCSWVEIESRRHVFVAGDSDHPDRKRVYEKLEDLDGKCKAIGYAPMTQIVLHDVDEMQKEAILSFHSEKLAVSLAVLQRGKKNGVVRVIKNLRVCGDCHNWMKFVSRVEGQEIVMRDSRRFHVFKDGRCSCGGYW